MRARAWGAAVDLRGRLVPPIEIGDLIRTSPNHYPRFRVIALSGGRVWIRDVQFGTDHVVAIYRCRKLDGTARPGGVRGAP